MIRENDGVFVLETANTTYSFRVMESGQLEHLYYGRKMHIHPEMMRQKTAFAPGNTVLYPETGITLEDVCLEASGYGKGDMREPLIELIHSDGSNTTDFVYQSFQTDRGKGNGKTLPGSIGSEKEVERLIITLYEKKQELVLLLEYCVYEECDVITRSTRLINESEKAVKVKRLMSLQLDFPDSAYTFTSFNGAWIREMEKHETKLAAGKHVNASFTGTSSNRANPFIMLSREQTTEDAGECFGFNLIYSGNHYEAAEVSSMGKLRLVTGINPANFLFEVNPGDELEAPEAVMTYSASGFHTLSANMHSFIRKHIVRGRWKNKIRPILLNSWETAYFDINEAKLLKLGKLAKNVGIELLVMDDGWFMGRNDDTSSLGDWHYDSKKLPGGLKGVADKINALGLAFGLWVEPEMVSVNSNLYRQHPEWVLEHENESHAEGRNQRILDLSNRNVQDFLIREMTRTFQSGNISYVKWDMNRNFSDYFSKALPKEKQGEVAHRYVCGLYRCMRELTKRFPDILFEGCASGGNRFDLGILCYFPQIWASDNTDAYARAKIQNNYSYGYPQEVMTSHVSDSPNHQTLRETPLDTRFHVASFANLGYECNLGDMKKEELEIVKGQIALYKKWRNVLQTGTFYRSKNFDSNHTMEWTVVSANQKKAVGFQMYGAIEPNHPNRHFQAKGLLTDCKYHFYNIPSRINIKDFGGLINTVAPVHIRHGSLMQDIASKVIKMETEKEEYEAYGDTLMYAGVQLSQGFCATGYNEQVSLVKDFSSRIYFMEGMDYGK